jgi:uncharacterized protein YjbI with pentapeptide repeats
MANEEHLALLKQGVWNEWRTENKLRYVVPDLSGANLSGLDLKGINFSFTNLRNTNLRGANLRGADFIKARIDGADLRETDLREALFDQGVKLSGANLVRANLCGLVLAEADLYLADLEEADLSEADLERAVLVEANLSKANLREANLSAADLSDAELDGASMIRAELVGTNLSVASLRGANLTGANLASGQARSTDFTEAIFTGACIEDWHINSSTKLDAVDCQYVYMKYGLSASTPTKIVYRERRPSTGNFGDKEFSKWIQKALDTLDLILQNPNWEAFAYSFRKIQIESEGEDLAIQSIENKGDGTVIVRVSVSPSANKEDLHSSFIQGYEFACKALKTQCEARLRDKEQEINQLIYLIGQEKELQKLMAENSSRNINTGGGNYIESNSGTYVEGDYINMSQNWTQATSSIEDLVNQRVQQQGVTVNVAQQQVANDLATQAQENPTVMGKLVKWGQSLANDAAKATVGDVAKGTVKLALRAAGLPLP